MDITRSLRVLRPLFLGFVVSGAAAGCGGEKVEEGEAVELNEQEEQALDEIDDMYKQEYGPGGGGGS